MVYAATPWGVYRWNSWQLGTVIDERYSFRPTAVSLEQNYPNPFNGQTTIAYKLPQAASVELTIYNMAGQRIKNVVDKKQSAGRHQVFWDGTDEDGRRVGSGVFFCRLSTDIQGQTRRMVLIR
jgi:flagellar hook assembly protein FlgD